MERLIVFINDRRDLKCEEFNIFWKTLIKVFELRF